jgi:hypothetical protein
MNNLSRQYYLAFLLFLTNTRQAFARPKFLSWPWGKKCGSDRSLSSNKPILFLDVDNTLYREDIYGIEQQIIEGIHTFCNDYFGLTPDEAQELHMKHGSTIQGMVDTHIASKNLVRKFYNEVYRNVSVNSLLQADDHSMTSTGYSHSSGTMQLNLVRALLQSSTLATLHIASNSPCYHIEKVIQALGLTQVPFQSAITPDSHSSKRYPTKAMPRLFFNKILQTHSPCKESSLQPHLIDDSLSNIHAARDYFHTHQVHGTNDGGDSLAVALCRALGFVASNYTFSQVDYLRAKNIVDLQSLHRATYQTMIQKVVAQLESTNQDTLVISDLGAGVLSMLKLLLEGHDDLPSLLQTISDNAATNLTSVHYYAYEANQALKEPCIAILQDMGFVWNETINDDEHVFVGKSHNNNHTKIVVYLRCWDFQDNRIHRRQPMPLLVVGCCFADLMDSEQLTRSILRVFQGHGGADERMLVYLPITFQGTTQFLPSKPFDRIDSSSSQSIPSDTCAFACYSKALEERHGHSLDPRRLMEAMNSHGGSLLDSGPSDWKIDPVNNAYLWDVMMYFFGTVACPELSCAGWNAQAFIERARQNRPTIYVSNFDLLFSLPPIGSWRFAEKCSTTPLARSQTFSQIEFTAPHEVRIVENKIPALKPNEVRIMAMYSLISSGTELKVYTGDFDDAALDVNIKGMEAERMAYPLTYGYCLVGNVVECGTGVHDANSLVGKLVFAFSPHTSQAVAERDAIQIVPDGIDPSKYLMQDVWRGFALKF